MEGDAPQRSERWTGIAGSQGNANGLARIDVRCVPQQGAVSYNSSLGGWRAIAYRRFGLDASDRLTVRNITMPSTTAVTSAFALPPMMTAIQSNDAVHLEELNELAAPGALRSRWMADGVAKTGA